MRVRVIDLDGAAAEQEPLAALILDKRADYIAARDLGPQLRIVASPAALDELDRRLGARDAGDPELFFYGSGDYHHIAYLLLRRLAEPVTILHFDNHPDWTRFPRSVNCGSWVSRALDLPHVERCITIGPVSSDLLHPGWKAADLGAMREGRLEVHAWHDTDTSLWGRSLVAEGATSKGGRLHWTGVGGERWANFIAALDARLGASALWITIDKDVLVPGEAYTNWDQGEMHVDDIVFAINALAAKRRILGVDVCGDYSEPRFKDPWRYLLAAFDRPSRPPPTPDEWRINERTTQSLLDAVSEVLA